MTLFAPRTIDRLTGQLVPVVRSRARFLASLRDDADPISEAQRLHREGVSVADIARLLEVDQRSVWRYLAAYTACPGGRCLTMVRGGGLCTFDRRSM